jgi:acetyl-CoA carboxylase, biotin carboxylase subunit
VRRVLIPNRGEIAVRIVDACRKLDLECVVGASEADLHGMAARMADRVVCLGPGPARDSYLRPDIVVQAALGAGCDTIHPGYGFLSENSRLASLAREHGLTFVGPPVAAIELAGDKLAARAAAQRAGVPVLRGGEAPSPARARELAREIGYPVLVKAAGGGGGRGIKRVDDESQLDALLSLARQEAGAAFADDRVYLERLVSPARHVEVQIAADEHGAVVHLGERDCSVQRRYQKVVEEAPAPALAPQTRTTLLNAAVAMAAELGYRNLGTVEFVVDPQTGEPFFLEVNCRIQVEHPVTEAVCDRDLVVMQLRIADGQRLGFSQDEVRFSGHAIECRLNAEDPARAFAPSPGTLELFSVPERPGLRVDTYCAPGAAIPPYYDSLMAKLIAHGENRDEAIRLLLDALADTDVEGVETNRTLLIDVLVHPDFQAARVTTNWLERVLQ